jgi:hypothetical protein
MPKTIEAKRLRGPQLAAMAAGGVSLALAYLPDPALAAPRAWEGYAAEFAYQS